MCRASNSAFKRHNWGTLFLCLAISLLSCSHGQAQPKDPMKPQLSDLQVISPEQAGFNRDSIANLMALIRATPPNDFRGLVVIKDQQIAIEEYFNTYWRNSVHDIRSAGKSVTALLLGIALKEGLVDNLDRDVSSFFAKSKFPNINEDYRRITLRNLLDMASGLDADTDNPQSSGHASKWIARDDWRDYLLQVPLTYEPGSRYVYADINPLLIAGVIEETSGMSLQDFARQKLFNPLGIKQFYWYTNAANQTGAAGNLYLSTLDFAKLGVLVINGGKWGSQQLLDAGYIKSLYKESFDLRDDNPYSDAYGMFWYKSHRTFGKNKFDYIYASGNGGNHLIVIPRHKMVIALTSSAYGPGIGHGRSYTIMGKILEAFEPTP